MRSKAANLHQDEAGQSVLIVLLLLMPILTLVVGLAYDLGNVAAAQTIAQDAADLAAQDAAKRIDVGHFLDTQEVILTPDAVWLASRWVDDMTDGRMQVLDLYTTAEAQIVLRGQVVIKTRFLGVIGLPIIHRQVVAVARPRYGAQKEGD